MFPQAATSSGLVLLRFLVAAMLHLDAVGRLVLAGPAWYLALLWLCSAALAAGFLTPLSAGIAAIIELSIFAGNRTQSFWPAVAALNALALVLLGPGGYSLDARLFGRRTVVMTVRREPEPHQRGGK